MKILKFGGTSLGNATRMRVVAEIIANENDCIVICSAMAGVTDKLQALAVAWREQQEVSRETITRNLWEHFQQTCYELMEDSDGSGSTHLALNAHFEQISQQLAGAYTPQKEKWLLAQGELITTAIFSDYLNSIGCSNQWLNALEIVQTNSMGEPVVADIRQRLESLPGFSRKGRTLTQGYICRDNLGNTDNLQRGGSDYTATLLGAAVSASVIEIWTDIDGLHQNDPRVVQNTRLIPALSFHEAAELAYFGAKILHPNCVWPAASHNIPIRLKNTLQISDEGTLISSEISCSGIRAVAAKDGITIIRIRSARMLNAYGFLRKVFEIFENYKTPIDVITTSEVAVSLTIDNPVFLIQICNDLAALGSVEIESKQSIVCIVGDVLARQQESAARILDALRYLPVKMVSLGGSRNNLTLVLPSEQKKEALLRLQQALFHSMDSILAQTLAS